MEIFATGVKLEAIEVEINGVRQWRWIATGFEDDTFIDGKRIDVFTYSETKENLIIQDSDDISKKT